MAARLLAAAEIPLALPSAGKTIHDEFCHFVKCVQGVHISWMGFYGSQDLLR
jgi:hypothetical protein